jgi:sulfate permease, SulP family
MMAIPLLFYVCVHFGGWTLDDARDYGWVGPNSPHPGSITDLLELIDLEYVDWSLMPVQVPVFLSMVFVVAFSSCLDVAAIEVRWEENITFFFFSFF